MLFSTRLDKKTTTCRISCLSVVSKPRAYEGSHLAKKERPLRPAGPSVAKVQNFVISADETAEDERVLTTEKLVVFVDICSSSSIVDNLIVNRKEQLYRASLVTLKRFLQERRTLCQRRQ